MYNSCKREPTFDALREFEPETLPVYGMIYGHEAEIYLDRTASGSMVQLTAEEVVPRSSQLGLPNLEGGG